MKVYYEDGSCKIIHGDCREVLPQLDPVHHVITDPPYSVVTHAGHNASANGHKGSGNDNANRKTLNYDHLTPDDCRELAALFATVSNGWIVWMSDHHLIPAIHGSLKSSRYVFAPLPFFAPGSTVRLSGDGPCSWTTWITVARTAALSRWGTLPGGYVAGAGWKDRQYMGGKPLRLMTALIGDYSKPGETIVDPFMGAGTTLRAAKDLGRKAIGIEINEKSCEIAAERLMQESFIF